MPTTSRWNAGSWTRPRDELSHHQRPSLQCHLPRYLRLDLFEKGNYAEARIYIEEAMKNEGGDSAGIIEHGGDICYMTG